MLTEYIWEIIPRNTPLLKRKCSSCGSESFCCSEKFRMNAQKKDIDIWLIYKCVKCKNTYNMTIFSRTRHKSISRELFNKFSDNDKETAREYAFSHGISRKNNGAPDFDSVQYDVLNDINSIEDILNSENEIVRIKIKYRFDFNLKLSSVIRRCLNLTADKLNIIIEEEVISVKEKPLQKKHKVRDEDIVLVNREKLRWIMQEFH